MATPALLKVTSYLRSKKEKLLLCHPPKSSTVHYYYTRTVATTLKRKSVSGRSLKIFQLLTNTPNQISGQQDRFLTRRATELVEYF